MPGSRNEEDLGGRVKPGHGACAMGGNMPNDDAKADPDIAATIDCDPPGLTRYYMMKRLVPVRG